MRLSELLRGPMEGQSVTTSSGGTGGLTTGNESEIEIRQVFEAADFGAALTPELRNAEARVAAQMAENAKR